MSRARWRPLLVALAVMVGATACGDELVFQRSADVAVVWPGDGAEVSLPLRVRWKPMADDVLADGGYYGIFIDTVPQAPGKTIWSLVEGKAGCADAASCRTEANLRTRGAVFTRKTSYLLDPIDFGNEGRLGRHRVTIALLDRDLRRIDENAYAVAFDVTKVNSSQFVPEADAPDAVAPDGTGADAGTGAAGGTDTGGGTTSGDTGGGGSAGLAGGGTTGGGSSGGGGGAGSAARPNQRMGAGVSATTINLGFTDSSDVAAANRAVGQNGLRDGEPRSFAEAFIAYFNRTGGIAGRKINPIWVDFRTLSGNSPEQNDQSACTIWTQDNQVFAGMGTGVGFRAALLDCMAKKGVVAVDTGPLLGADDDDARRYFKTFYQLSKLTYDRTFKLYVDQLIANGYFENGARVGLLYTDIPAQVRAVDRTLRPYLKSKGITLVDEQRVIQTYGIDSLAQAQAQTNNAVLRFQSARVTHVLAPTDPFSFQAFFSRADQQGYRPRYGLTSSIAGIGGPGPSFGPQAQFEKAMLVAYNPALGEAEVGENAKVCWDMLRAQGHRIPDQAIGQGYAIQYCDFLLFMRAALDKADSITADGLAAGAAAMGTQRAGGTWSYRITADRHDGGQQFRVATYSGGSWRYLTGLAPVG